MRGLVFTEFYGFVEAKFSPELLEEMIEQADLGHAGAYTSVGNYDHRDMLALLGALSQLTHTPVETLSLTYGHHLFGCFVTLFPAFFDNVGNSHDFLARLEKHIHSEVRKLYPDARPPRIETRREGDATLVDYSSHRPFAALALGLIEAAIAHFSDNLTVTPHGEADDPRQSRFVVAPAEPSADGRDRAA